MLEGRVQQSSGRAGRVMARPLDMMKCNKRKEVEDLGGGGGVGDNEEEEGVSGVSEKRLKLYHDAEELPCGNQALGSSSSSDLMERVSRLLEARWRKSTRPLPAKIGNKDVDLVALHSRVQTLGGYSKVTEAKLWSSVSGALGFGAHCGPGVKLVFVKYLKALELDEHCNEVTVRVEASSSKLAKHSQNGDTDICKANDSAAAAGAAGVMSDEDVIEDLRDRDLNQLECRQSFTSEDWVTTDASLERLDGNPSCRDEGARGLDEDLDASSDWYEGIRVENVQQQREALRGMMEWIRRVAVCPGDDSAIEGISGQDDVWASQCLMLTAKVRSVLWKGPGRGGHSFNRGKQVPSLYYDDTVRPDAQTLEKLRASRERLVSFGFQPPPGPQSQHLDSSYWGIAGAAYPGQRSGRHAVNNYNDSPFSRYNQQRKRIPTGPESQADVPEWVPRDRVYQGSDTTLENSAGEGPTRSDADENDERRLGVTVYPRAGAVGSSFRPVGRGRPDFCDCEEPGSIHCVRVHIAIARERLRSELGPAFVDMGFDQMGECVADDYWSREDERTFRQVARSHPASKSGNFWDYLPRHLPHKTRMELNSYYFNVFVLRRRALQNRLRDCKIDSDDDEGELPGESEESEYGSTDDEDEEDDDDEDDTFSDGADGAGSEGVPDTFPLKTPMDAGMLKYRPLPVFNYSPAEQVAPSRAQLGVGLEEAESPAKDLIDRLAPEHADNSHVVLMWDDKNLEPGTLVRDGRHWEEHPDWGGRDHPEVSPVLGEAVQSRPLSPAKEDVRQGAVLTDLWTPSMEMAPKREKDKLLSTNGMILELFGDDICPMQNETSMFAKSIKLVGIDNFLPTPCMPSLGSSL